MSIGTFGSFTQARLAIYASQTGLTVTGNKIANINTEGYTRQKLEQSSFYAGGSDRYYATNDMKVGRGVLCTGVSQIRDPYLDIRFRTENASVGVMDAKLAGLEDIQRILDEVGDGEDGFGVLGAQLNGLYHQLQQLSDQTGHAEYDIQVRSSANAVVKLFNSYASQLKKVEENAVQDLNQDVKTVNTLLNNIRDLNSSIRKAQIHGDNALELQDQRNMLIDQLSGYIKIDVVMEKEPIGIGVEVDKLTIRIAGMDPKDGPLVDGVHSRQLSLQSPKLANPPGPNQEQYVKILDPAMEYTDNPDEALLEDTPFYGITLTALKDDHGLLIRNGTADPVQLEDTTLYGSLQAQREFLTEAGEFATQDQLDTDPEAATKRGLPYYQKTLDLLANQLAPLFNQANQSYIYNENGEYLNQDGEVLMLDGISIKVGKELTDGQKNTLGTETLDAYLTTNGKPTGFPMFENQANPDNPDEPTTASNLIISSQWASGATLVTSFVQPTGMDAPASTDRSNILHMLALMDEKTDYKVGSPPDDKVIFNGTFNEMWNNIGTVLGNDMMTTATLLDTYYASSVQLDTNRDSVSSVDLNDEAMNLMQYSKSYNAACRLMTTLDAIPDKLINGTSMTT